MIAELRRQRGLVINTLAVCAQFLFHSVLLQFALFFSIVVLYEKIHSNGNNIKMKVTELTSYSIVCSFVCLLLQLVILR